MSIEIYTYHDPYKIDKEEYWKDISNCPYYCVSQTLVNGLRRHYRNPDGSSKFEEGRVTTVKYLTDSLYKEWASPSWIVRQHTHIDNIIRSGALSDATDFDADKLARAFLFNRDEVFNAIRTLFELNVDINAILLEKLSKEQRFIVELYRKILSSVELRKDFYLSASLSEEDICYGINKSLTALDENYDPTGLNLNTIVIHGVHQFSPIMLRAIDELQKYKRVILLFNYQKQYKTVYQTWMDIYSAFDSQITDCFRTEFAPSDETTVSYKGNVLADQLGKLVDGQRKRILVRKPYDIIEFDNMTEFANYVADVFESAMKKDADHPMKCMKEQIYAANSTANDILKIYFPEQFGERQFLNYPLGHFFIAIANMWDPEKNDMVITDLEDLRECLNSGIIVEDYPGELTSIFGKTQALFEGCTSILQMEKRIKRVIKNKRYVADTPKEEYIEHIGYYSASKDDLQKLQKALEELNDIAKDFYEDFQNRPHNFREFYRRLKNYLQTDILEDRKLSDEFEDIIRRVLERLNAVENIDASASFECLKSMMSIYLLQESKPGTSANWIVRNFEQIDGDIYRSGHEDPNTIYHFACLADDDMNEVNRTAFPWPLNDEFFEVAQDPVDWKYQVYVKSCSEYKNFKRYALIYGLEFNRAKFKLSYVKRDGDKEREPYYLLKMLGLKIIRNRASRRNLSPKDSTGIQFSGDNESGFDEFDYYRYRICKYRFLSETLIENNTVYKDSFLLLKYLEVLLENAIKEDMQGMPISEPVVVKKLNETFEELQEYFPFVQNVNRIDIINNIRNRLVRGKEKKFANLTPENRKYMLLRELFIYKKLETAGTNVLADKFPSVSKEYINEVLNPEKLENIDYTVNVEAWCQYCSNRELCIAYYKDSMIDR